MTVPINAKTFPYRRQWTKAQIEEILERKDRIAETMTDAVGPVGQILYVPPDQLHILALHLSLAGCDVNEDLAYIVAEILPDEPGQFENRHHWHLKKDYEPAKPDPDETKNKAAAAADQIRRQLPPEVREHLSVLLSQEMANRRTEAIINSPGGTQ